MQTLSIRGFLGIDLAEIKLDSVTILIGEQATGKSVIARLVYFFNEYFANFDEISLSKNEHKSTYDKRKKNEFCQIFPTYSWEDSNFDITFSNELHNITISSNAKSSVIDLKTSPSVATYFRNLKKDFSRFHEQVSSVENIPYSQLRILREFRRAQEENNVHRYESPLFVPAARSFYATIRDEIFSILALDNKIDNIILQFGEFYESAKLRRAPYTTISPRHNYRPVSAKVENNYFERIVKGQLIREDGRDWIAMDRGKIELSKASSGQQEAIPLLVAISRFPQEGRTLIIEEPEAHLFPSAQVQVLDYILRQAKTRKTGILFTTHSPYLLSATNNYILRSKLSEPTGGRSIDGNRINVYCLSDSKAHSLIDKETGLISADYIDSVSVDIATEFEQILEAINESE